MSEREIVSEQALVFSDMLEELEMNWLAKAIRDGSVPSWLKQVLRNGPDFTLVTTGEYSDYSVVGVFSSRAFAQEYVQKLSGSYSRFNEPEPLQIDQNFESGKFPFVVTMDREGNTNSIMRHEGSFFNCAVWFVGPNRHTNNQQWIHCECWADDERHAVKIANEKRIALLIEENLKT